MVGMSDRHHYSAPTGFCGKPAGEGRGVVPDDQPYSCLTMRNDAFREADLIVILGTRTNYAIGHALPAALPRRRQDRTRRQGGQAQCAGHLPARRRLVRAERMELDTAVRRKLPLLCVISLNGG